MSSYLNWISLAEEEAMKEAFYDAIKADQIGRQIAACLGVKSMGSSLTAYLTGISDDSLVDRKSPLHLSASALVFDEERLFFIEHPYQKEYLLPAGHVDPGEWPQQTAIRELQEETGRSLVGQWTCRLVDINLISIPHNPSKKEGPHYHLDFRYLVSGKVQQTKAAELPVALLSQSQAPLEFRPYYSLNQA